MSTTYPVSAFYFQLSISDLSSSETSFKEVSGIQMELATEEISEGGENRFKYRVPTGAKYQNLILKRGMTSASSALTQWCTNTIGGGLAGLISLKTIVVNLLDEKGNVLKSWSFQNAWPVRWEVAPLNSMNNEVLIETLEFSFTFFIVLK